MRAVPGVLVDRVNIGGNETGQQSNFASKGTRPQDASWTLDGIEITDMAATGASPTYFNYDNFEEIQVSTAGNDIKPRDRRHRPEHGRQARHQPVPRQRPRLLRQRRDGIVQRARRAAGDRRDATRPPITTSRSPTTAASSADRSSATRRGSTASYSMQDVRLVRRAGALVDRTQLKNPNVKVNWQATKKDNAQLPVSSTASRSRTAAAPASAGILFDAPTATYHQDNAYTDTPFHGLWKIADDRVFGTNMFVVGEVRLLQHRLRPRSDRRPGPAGGPQLRRPRTSYGSVNQSLNVRPQQIANVDAQLLPQRRSAPRTTSSSASAGARVDAISGTLLAGQHDPGDRDAPNNLQAQVFRQGYGGNRANYLDFYVGDTHRRATAGRSMSASASTARTARRCRATTLANAAFPTVVPGFVFAGYKTPFTWNNCSPRAGVTYALDELAQDGGARQLQPLRRSAQHRHRRRAAIRRSTAGSATYRWIDLNGDHFAQANEVRSERSASRRPAASTRRTRRR